MKIIRVLTVILGTVAIGATIASAGNPVKDRKELMKSVGKATKLSGMMVQGKIAFDAGQAAEAMKTISQVPDKFVKLFPKNSDNENSIMEFEEESTASPKIWTEWKKFEVGLTALKEASSNGVKAAGEGAGAFKAAFGNMVKLCKGCHEAYRIKKKE